MDPELLLAHFEALIEATSTLEQRSAAESALAADPLGRRLLAARQAFQVAPETELPDGLLERVMAALPELPVGARSALAELIVAAWADPGVREAVRRDPRGVLAARGVAFPERVEVAAVTPAEAGLPTGDRVVVPLPAPGRPAIDQAEARRQLGATDIGWLWGPPWVRGSATPPADPVPGTFAPSAWRGLQRLVPALVTVAAVVALVWILGRSQLGAGGLSGAAAGDSGTVVSDSGAWPLAGLAVGLALTLAVAWLWWRRR